MGGQVRLARRDLKAANRAVEIFNGASDQTTNVPLAQVMPSIQIDPKAVYRVNEHSAHASRQLRGSLIDRGANGGILGNDARVIFEHIREVDVTGIDNHQINALKLVDATAKVTTNCGPVIVVM